VSLYCLKFFVVGCSLFGLIVRTPRPWVSLLQFRRTAPVETPRRAPEGGGGSGRDAKKRKKAKMRAVHALQLISTEIDRRNDHQTIDRDAIRFRRMLARIGSAPIAGSGPSSRIDGRRLGCFRHPLDKLGRGF
jgi:hypothetical protein